MIRPLLLSVFIFAGLVSAPAIAVAWESYPPPLTLRERIAEWDTVVFGEFLSSIEPAGKKGLRDGRYRILHLAKPTKAAEVGQIVIVTFGGSRIAGERAMLTRHKGDWRVASPPISRVCFDYAMAAPDPDEEDSKRVPYFLRHLNSSDRQISDDAFVELERAEFRFVVASSKLIPREFVAARLRDEATNKHRVGPYGVMLGLAGNESDRELLRGIMERAPREDDPYPLGHDGIAGGYLLLAGAEGLDRVEEIWVKDPEVSFWRTYSAMQAIRFMWRYGEGRISRPRLRESMRLFLDLPELADLAIADLARWEDWSLHDRLLAMSHNPESDKARIKRAIVRYMSVSALVPPEVQAHDPARFQKARHHIRGLQNSPPEWFAEHAMFLLRRHGFSSDGSDPPDDDDSKKRREETIARLRGIGATVFLGDGSIWKENFGRVIEVNANRKQITDGDLKAVGEFLTMTDLSLEETAITDKGLAHLTKLDGLVWLNLYQTKITDEGLRHVAKLKRLELLPIGETKVTDKGLAHLKKMTQLTYLGLRGNPITDKGVAQLAGLTNLTSLYLGETKVTDAGLESLAKMTKLKKLWLNNTAVSDEAIPLLAELKSLRELHVEDSKITAEGVAALRKKVPACEILDGR
jgi:hypothetical protein